MNIQDVWAGRDGLLEEVYQLRREKAALIEANGKLREIIEEHSPWPERMV